MARKGSLVASMKAAKAELDALPIEPVLPTLAQVERLTTGARSQENVVMPSKDTITTAIHIPRDVHDLLRRVAVERAVRAGGRPSVSAVLAELVHRHWDELTAEAAR